MPNEIITVNSAGIALEIKPLTSSGNATGALWAVSDNVPAAGAQNVPHELAVTWTNQTGSPLTVHNARLRVPLKPAADNVLGFWLVSKSSGTIRDKVFFPWGQTRRGGLNDRILLCGATAGCMQVWYSSDTGADYTELQFNALNPIPANTALEVYAALAGGDKGDKGDPGTAGASDELSTRSSVPATAGFTDGDIVNVNGVLYELVPSTQDANVYRGTVAAPSSGFYGTADFQWQTASPFNIRVKLPKAALGLSPPSRLYPKITFAGHGTSDLELARASGQDTSTQYAYVHNPGSPGLDFDTVGTAFSVAFYSDNQYATAFTIHTASRWERDDRNQPNVASIALADNTDRWPKAKLPSDTVYGTVRQVPTNAAADEGKVLQADGAGSYSWGNAIRDGTVTGRLLATSSTLPTAPTGANNGRMDLTWTTPPGSRLSNGSNFLRVTFNRDINEIGLWIEVYTNDVFQHRTMLPDGMDISAQHPDDPPSVFMGVQVTAGRGIEFTAHGRFITFYRGSFGETNQIPANTHLKVYACVVQGIKGDAGPQGPAGAAPDSNVGGIVSGVLNTAGHINRAMRSPFAAPVDSSWKVFALEVEYASERYPLMVTNAMFRSLGQYAAGSAIDSSKPVWLIQTDGSGNFAIARDSQYHLLIALDHASQSHSCTVRIQRIL